MTKRIIDALVVAAQTEKLAPKDIRIIQGKLIRGLARLNNGDNWVRGEYVTDPKAGPICFCSVGAIAGPRRKGGHVTARMWMPELRYPFSAMVEPKVGKRDRKTTAHVKALRHATGFLGNVIHRHGWGKVTDIYSFKSKHDDTALNAFATSEGKVTNFNDGGTSYSQVAKMFRIAINELGILADHMEKLA